MCVFNELFEKVCVYKKIDLTVTVYAEGYYRTKLCVNCNARTYMCECEDWDFVIYRYIKRTKMYINISAFKLLHLIKKHEFVNIVFGISIPREPSNYANCHALN